MKAISFLETHRRLLYECDYFWETNASVNKGLHCLAALGALGN